MSFYRVAAQVQASPSVSLEKGAYRMRAPPKRPDPLLPRSLFGYTVVAGGGSTRSRGSPSSRSSSSRSPSSPKPRRHARGSEQTMSRDTLPTVLQYERRMAMVVVFLVCATVSCFGLAYYLFATR